jgi:hypothetical protein
MFTVRAEPLMNTDADVAADHPWSTSSLARADSLDRARSAPGAQLELRRSVTRRLLALRGDIDAALRFAAPRLMSTLVLATLLIGVSLTVS